MGGEGGRALAGAVGEDGVDLGKVYEYDLIILDVMLPGEDGYSFCRRLRASGVKLLWGTANLFGHPRYAAGAATNPDPGVAVPSPPVQDRPVTLVLRYIWITAGGVDSRANLPAGGKRLALLPRAGRSR